MADNVKPARGSVTAEVIGEYFDNVEKELEGVSPHNILNFDETNVTDDPGKKKVFLIMLFYASNEAKKKSINLSILCLICNCSLSDCCESLRRVINVRENSKQAFSVMFCGDALGKFLPPMVVYKSKKLVYKLDQKWT